MPGHDVASQNLSCHPGSRRQASRQGVQHSRIFGAVDYPVEGVAPELVLRAPYS